MNNKVVLITGASSGIGFTCAEYFTSRGFKVYGTTRKISQNKQYPCNVTMLELDICIDESVTKAVESVIKAEGKIDILVNNAGYGIAGAIEDTDVSYAQSQMDTNFMGIHRMCKAVLPYMREASNGRRINISSVAGFVPIPFQAFYTASKYAVEAYTRALRLEVAPFGITVCAVEPGDTRTGFTSSREYVLNAEDTVYANVFKRSISRMEKDEQNGEKPVNVAKVVYKQATSRRPKICVAVGFQYKLIKLLLKILPDRIALFVIGKLYT